MRSVMATLLRGPLLLVLCVACSEEREPRDDGGAEGLGAQAEAGVAQTSADASRASTYDAAESVPVDSGQAAATRRDANVAAEVHDAASAPSDAGAAAALCAACATYAPPVQRSQLAVSELAELSGLTVGHENPELMFAHNDRMRTTVYGLDFDGNLRATITLDRAFATDPEDIAVGPCPEGTCLYLADIGDNAAARKEYAILRFAEPPLQRSAEVVNLTVTAQRFTFVYEDGSHNAEGFMVAPSGVLYVVTKGSGPSSVYRLPALLDASRHNIASKVATLPVPAASDMAASAAAAHPCGLGFLLRTYDKVYEFRANGSDFESAFAATPKLVGMPSEPQSEGISYLADGRGFISAGEGASAPIFAARCE